MSRLPLDQVDAFVTAARLRNLTRAAEAMHLTVSALSRSSSRHLRRERQTRAVRS